MGLSMVPIGDRVIIEPTEFNRFTESGLELVTNEKSFQGRVVAVGDGRTLSSGRKVKLRVEIGDEVFFSKLGGTELSVSGRDLICIAERDVIMKIVDSDVKVEVGEASGE